MYFFYNNIIFNLSNIEIKEIIYLLINFKLEISVIVGQK